MDLYNSTPGLIRAVAAKRGGGRFGAMAIHMVDLSVHEGIFNSNMIFVEREAWPSLQEFTPSSI